MSLVALYEINTLQCHKGLTFEDIDKKLTLYNCCTVEDKLSSED